MKRWMVAVVLSLLAVSSAQAGQALTPKKSVKKPNPKPQIQTLAVQAAQPRPSYEAYAVADYGSGQVLQVRAAHLFLIDAFDPAAVQEIPEIPEKSFPEDYRPSEK